MDIRSIFVLICAFTVAACSNGGSGSDQRAENTLPNIQLNDGDVLSNGNSIIRIPASDDTGIATVSARILRQGKLEECRAELDFSLIRDSLFDACLADQPTCSVDFIPTTNEVVVYPPPLYAPIGLEYELSFVDRDGSATDPTKAVFCFDVGANAPPTPAADTYQLIYPGFVQKNGVNYGARCEKAGGSDGVLANDDDDEHISNECLTAELVELPQFASNSSFRQSFRSNGGFRYEALSGGVPASNVDRFTYRVSDGVNPPGPPITVEIVFSGENSPPVASNNSFDLAEDNPSQALDVLANDADPDSLPLTITAVFNGPANGVANIRNGVIIDYVPNADFNGEDQFSYSITDSGGLVANANVSLNISGVNDPPVAQNDIVTTDKNVAFEINVLANDSDLEADNLSISSIATPANGTAVVSSNGQIFYTPNLNFSGSDPFEYTISDGKGGSATATAVVTIRFVNVAPVANEDSLTAEEGVVATLDVTANDTDADGDTLVVVELTQPANGMAEIVSDSVVRYTPNENYNGPDTFSYRVSDGTTDSWAEVNVNVGAVNDLPVAIDDTISTTENNAVVIGVTANDTDPDGDFLSISSVTQAISGAVTLSEDRRSVTYTPAALFSGTDSFVYTVTDGNGGTDTAIVTVQVTDTNGPPLASNDSVTTPQDTAITIDVLSNDSDPDNDPLTLTIINGASSGTAVVQGAAILYTPNTGFDGSDSFTYQIADVAGLAATAQVSVTVSDVNVAPVAVDDSIGVNENTAVTVNVLTNDTDLDGDSLSIASVGTAASGTAVVQGNSIVYTPVTDFAGQDAFTYQVTDGKGGSDTGNVVVTVSNVNRPPVAGDDSVSNEQDDAISIAVLVNDTDPDNDSLTIQSVSTPSSGEAAIATGGQRIVYRPVAGFVGIATFQYTISDGNQGVSTATVTVDVIGTNAPPVAQPDTAVTPQNTPVTIDVTGNDTDANSDPVVLASVGLPDNGTTALSNGSVIYTPAEDFFGEDTFSYVIDDGNSGQATGTVTVTVQQVVTNTAPVAQDDEATTVEDNAVVIDILLNDSDFNGDPLTVTISPDPGNGSAVFANGLVTYTPVTGFTGTDSFGYGIDDGNGGSATATVVVNVDPASVPLAAADDTGTTDQDVTATFDVLANDTFGDLASLTLLITTNPDSGQAVVVNNAIEYTPAPDFSGPDSIGYTISDGSGGSATASVSITVNAVVTVTPPVAMNDEATTPQDTPILIPVLANDENEDQNTLIITITVPPTSGTALVQGEEIEYTPTTGYTGPDTFEYTIDDEISATSSATVSIDVTTVAPPVTSANLPPTAMDDTATTTEGVLVVVSVLDNDQDPDNDQLSVAIETPAENGTLEVRPNRRVIYTPDAGFTGTDSFVYAIDDDNGGTDTAIVTITVDPAAA